MIVSGLPMESDAPKDYLLGSTDGEHERLIRQAIRLAPVTERFFREAGLAQGTAFSTWVPEWEMSLCYWRDFSGQRAK